MGKSKVLWFVCCLLSWTPTVAADDEPLQVVAELPAYQNLSRWVQDVERPGFELVFGKKTKNCLVAIFRVGDDLAVCTYGWRLQEWPSVGVQVLNSAGARLIEFNSPRRKTLARRFRVEKSEGVAEYRYVDGEVIGLRQPIPSSVRVIVNVVRRSDAENFEAKSQEVIETLLWMEPAVAERVQP